MDSNLFKKISFEPQNGTINVDNERYILVRAESLSVKFFEFVKNIYPALDDQESIDAANRILYDIAYNMGQVEAKAFHNTTGFLGPVEKISTGLVRLAYTGWAFVDILQDSIPSGDENYYLIYDQPQSFEADTWLKQKGRTNHCTCTMNAGYFAGWCSETFSINLIAREILCKSKGDEYCRFIMAHTSRINSFIDTYKTKNPELFKIK